MKIFRFFKDSALAKPSLIFIFALIIISLFYDYQDILLKRPQSVHHWRQSDCASLALNYYQQGMHFFQPQTHNLTSDGCKSGYVSTSEVPLLYYFIAILYKIFGYHDFIYRLVNTLIFFSGLYCLFLLLKEMLSDTFWGIALSLLFFTSPILVYYGNNFLTDSSALSFSLIGWYFFFKFIRLEKDRHYFVSMLFFLLAGSCKISAGISILSLFGIYLIELLHIYQFKNGSSIFKKKLLYFLPFLVIFLIVGGWAIYANHYNYLHRTDYFSTTIFPIWTLDKEGISKVLDGVKVLWLNQYFNRSVLVLVSCFFIFTLAFMKKANLFLLIVSIFMFLGVSFYIILWFSTFLYHDYYTINLYILLIFAVITFFNTLKNNYEKILTSKIVKIIFLLFLLFNIWYARLKVSDRYNGLMNEYPKFKDNHVITPYLRSLGLSYLDTVVSIPDDSHATLYLMNLKGTTECYNQNGDSLQISKSVQRGAKYLIINSKDYLYRDYLQSYLYHKIGEYGQVTIFKLDSQKCIMNDIQVKTKTKDSITIDAEALTSDGRYFISSNQMKIETNHLQSNENAYSGKNSIKLTNNNPYGLMIKLKDVNQGEHFIISVYRSTSSDKGGIIASSDRDNKFYYGDNDVRKSEKKGWQKLVSEFYVPVELPDHILAIYLWNINGGTVFFDDLKIVRIKIN
jgi:hypothetical protein